MTQTDAPAAASKIEVMAALAQSREIINLTQNLERLGDGAVIGDVLPALCRTDVLSPKDVRFFSVEKLSYDEEYPRREAFENVLLAQANQAYNFVYMLTGSESGVQLDLGVMRNQNELSEEVGAKLSASDVGEILENVFEGNFAGSKLRRVTRAAMERRFVTDAKAYRSAGVITGVPSINEMEGDDVDFQGIDRLINSMMGGRWRLMIVCEPVPQGEIAALRREAYELYNRLSVCAKQTLQKSVNDGTTISFSKNTSDSRTKSKGTSKTSSASKGGSKGQSSSTNWNESSTVGTNDGISESRTTGSGSSFSANKGSSQAVTVEIANKHAQEMMKYIDEELLPRLRQGFSKGLFKTSVYYMAESATLADRLKVGIMSLFQGSKSSFSPLLAQTFDTGSDEIGRALKNCLPCAVDAENVPGDALLLLSRPYRESALELGTYMTADEVSLLAGLPQKEVPGLSLREAVGFGLNENTNSDPGRDIRLGTLVHKGRVMEGLPFYLPRDALQKHTFIAGTTGSGKTTTCLRLIKEAREVPFLVIEPAKTEYRALLADSGLDGLTVFTLGNETAAPFRINPFELIPGEVISAHVDMLKATFTSAFPMEASMPQLLEESIYRCYAAKGWNVDTNENERYGERAFAPDVDPFPTLSELLATMSKVVEEKGFSPQMKADYIGSLVSRLSNLTVGSKGAMLNCVRSTDFSALVHGRAVLELEELRSSEDKALVMGFILSRLSAVIKEEHRKDPAFRHITLVEEAHRLLAKVEPGDGGARKAAVETFTDLLAEVRKYGEGLIIVDQIPNKLAPEVLKNTNTKIVHKILARDDKETVGDTMLMDDKQKGYLSALRTGETVIFSENTDKPVNVQIAKSADTAENSPDDTAVRERFIRERPRFGTVYDDLEIVPFYRQFDEFAKAIGCFQVNEEQCRRMKDTVAKLARRCGSTERDVWTKFIKRRERVTGKAATDPDRAELRLSEQLEFFGTTLYKPDLSIEDARALKLKKIYLI